MGKKSISRPPLSRMISPLNSRPDRHRAHQGRRCILFEQQVADEPAMVAVVSLS
jgi:hypothetical protein